MHVEHVYRSYYTHCNVENARDPDQLPREEPGGQQIGGTEDEGQPDTDQKQDNGVG